LKNILEKLQLENRTRAATYAIGLGPERLARAAREIGKLVRNLKAYMGSLTEEL
jgi:hypothetical protein